MLQVNELGHRDVDARLPMQRDTIFRIASMTKPVTVAAAMALIEEGKLALTDPVAQWLPELADMQVLLDPRGPLDKTDAGPPAHHDRRPDDAPQRAGLRVLGAGPLASAYGRMSFRQDQDRWLAELAKLPLAHQPGDAAHLQPRHRRARHRAVADRGQAAVRRARRTDLRDRSAWSTPDSRWAPRDGAAPRRCTSSTRTYVLQHDVMGPAPITDPPFCTGGAGLWSTVDDYLRFARMLLAGGTVDGVRVLSRNPCG